VPANHPEIIVFLAAAFANDVCDAAPALSNNAPAFFPLGSNEVEFTANDNQSNLASCSANVIVDDTTPPEIQSISATPDNLWSPNHKMVPVTVSVDVQDTCDAAPVCRIVGVSTNEAELGPGSGNTSPDWSIEGGLTVNLRSERSGRGSGRIYDVAVECEDASGNAAQGSVAVSVAHDKS
jgi:hypothetical protein